MPDETEDHNCFHVGEQEEPTRTPLYCVDEDYIQQDLKSNNLCMNEAVLNEWMNESLLCHPRRSTINIFYKWPVVSMMYYAGQY